METVEDMIRNLRDALSAALTILESNVPEEDRGYQAISPHTLRAIENGYGNLPAIIDWCDEHYTNSVHAEFGRGSKGVAP